MNTADQADRIIKARALREQLLADRYRPGYHFAIPEDVGFPGDSNGAFFANGRYHLMYLYNRRGVHAWQDNGFCWGHISSVDLVHWRYHPDAILPGDGDGGCFSGGGFVDDDGDTKFFCQYVLFHAFGESHGLHCRHADATPVAFGDDRGILGGRNWSRIGDWRGALSVDGAEPRHLGCPPALDIGFCGFGRDVHGRAGAFGQHLCP